MEGTIMNRDLFALLESKRAWLTAAGTFWVQTQQELGFDLGPDSKAYIQLGLFVAFILGESIRPAIPKGIITVQDKRPGNGN